MKIYIPFTLIIFSVLLSFNATCQELDSLEKAKIYLDSCNQFSATGNIEKAISFGEKSLDLCLNHLGKEDTLTARVYQQTGIVLHKKKNYKKALLHLYKALEIWTKKIGKYNPDVTNCYYNIGLIHKDKTEYNKTDEYFKKAVENLNHYEENKLLKAKYFINLGAFYQSIGEHFFALEINLKALDIVEKSPEKNNYLLAVLTNNIGAVYQNLGKYDLAIDYYKKLSNIDIKLSDDGLYHNNIGVVFLLQGKYDKAREYFKKALGLRLKSLVEDHPLIAASFNNIGLTYQYKAEYDKALQFIKKALDLNLSTLPIHHPNISANYFIIGEIYFAKKQYDLALENHQKALDLRSEYLGEEHYSFGESLNNMGEIYTELGEYDNALKNYEKAMSINLETYGTSHIEVAFNNFIIGNLYLEIKDYEKTIEHHHKALSIGINELGSHHPNVIESHNQLGITYRKQKKYSQSIYHFKEAIKSLDDLNKKSTFVEAKKFQSSKAKVIFENLVSVILESDKSSNINDTIFTFTEKSKSNLLLNAIHASRATHFSNIPDSIITKEQNLKIDIAYFDKKIQQKKNSGQLQRDSSLLNLTSKRLDLKMQLDSLTAYLEKNNPLYFTTKYDASNPSLKTVQNELLNPNQSLIEYLLGDSSLFIFLVKKDIRVLTILQTFSRKLLKTNLI